MYGRTNSYVAPGMPDLPIPGDTWKVSEWSLEKKNRSLYGKNRGIVIAKVKFAAILRKKTR